MPESVFTHTESLFKVVALILEEYFMNSRPIIMWQAALLRFSVNTFALRIRLLLLEAETRTERESEYFRGGCICMSSERERERDIFLGERGEWVFAARSSPPVHLAFTFLSIHFSLAHTYTEKLLLFNLFTDAVNALE